EGNAARQSLEKITTHNLKSLTPGRCAYGFLLNPEGGVLDDLIVYCLRENQYMLVVNGACTKNDFAWIKARLPKDTSFKDISEQTAKIDLQGPKSYLVLENLLGQDLRSLKYFNFTQAEFQGGPLLVSRTGYTGELGYEFYLDAAKAESLWDTLLKDSRVLPAGLGARDTLRLEMGYPLYGQDLDTGHTPAEAGYQALLASEADYVGKDNAFRVRERLVGLEISGRQSARHHNKVFLPSGREVGVVTSGSFSPSLGHAIALAYVTADAAEEENLLIDTGRSKLSAVNAKPPFYKQGTARVKLL
ncbi:MAG: glycine cleavage system aminomethyltransferase GcvT, partial [Thermodesulfobacteriota bacterium]|nr:glycine cleavage system aminomethyltransferase GcvT [Thermodesulfobacteriota bacterium]